MPEPSLGLSLAPGDGEPLYQQIFDQIAARIRRGTFPEGYRLPPTRALASELGTHRNTVVRAYAELEQAGFLTSTVGRGTFVRGRAAPATTATATARATAKAAEPVRAADATYPTPRGLPWGSLLSKATRAEPLRRFTRMQATTPTGDTINLTRMEPPAELLPVDAFARCVKHVLRTSGARALGYGPKPGHPLLREGIAKDLARLGVPAREEDVLVTTGSQQGLDLVARALLDPGDLVLTHASTYAGALQVFAAVGATIAGVPDDAEGPELEALRRLGPQRPKLLYLMPNHANPTGACMSAGRREAVLEWARDAQVVVVEDDYAADLVLDPTPVPPALRALDAEVIHVGTFSKRLIPALRIGYLVAPAALRPHLIALKHTTDLGSSVLSQLALAELLERGYLAAHLNRIQPAYRARRDALLEALRSHLPDDVRWQRPTRGVSVWLELPRDVDPGRVFDEGVARKVLVGPGHVFAADEGTRPGLKVNFCFEPEERLREGARRIGAAIEAARRQPARGGERVDIV